MEIRILKNLSNYKVEILSDNTIIEKETTPSEYDKIKRIHIYSYNSDTNTKEEICPKIKKFDIASFINVCSTIENVYFIGCENDEVSVYSYNCHEKNCIKLCVLDNDISSYMNTKRIKIFILNANYFIVEYEKMRSNKADSYMGYLDFSLYMYDVRERRRVDICDENIINNGIASIIPINDNTCVIKTGFSLLKDRRYRHLTKEEASVEGVGIVNPSQLISDILLMKKNIMFEIYDQTYYNITIPYVDVKGDYIIYSKVDTQKNEEELIFYNAKLKATTNCIRKNVKDEKDLTKYYILNNIPFILLDTKDKTELYNLVKNTTDIKLDNTDTIIAAMNDIICTRSTKKSWFSGIVNYAKVYKYPKNNVLLKEKAFIKDALITNDVVYIITN